MLCRGPDFLEKGPRPFGIHISRSHVLVLRPFPSLILYNVENSNKKANKARYI